VMVWASCAMRTFYFERVSREGDVATLNGEHRGRRER